MTVHELYTALSQMDRTQPAAEALAVSSAVATDSPFWQQMVCTGLRILRTTIHLDAQQDAAWQVVQDVLCGG